MEVHIHSYPRHYMGLSGQFHTPTALSNLTIRTLVCQSSVSSFRFSKSFFKFLSRTGDFNYDLASGGCGVVRRLVRVSLLFSVSDKIMYVF